jgi:glyoxylase-like metal-dependent hydrolase (beta-lactamase superfamily II)
MPCRAGGSWESWRRHGADEDASRDSGAGAAAAQATASCPLGRAQVVDLSDGAVHNDFATLVAAADRLRLRQIMPRDGGPVRDASVNAYLIRLDGPVLLVDSGAGTLFGPTVGHVREALAAAGVAPGAVTDVFITHLHPDHFGGLLGPDGAPPSRTPRSTSPARTRPTGARPRRPPRPLKASAPGSARPRRR